MQACFLDCKAEILVYLRLVQREIQCIKLLFDVLALVFWRKRDFFKLRMTDDNRVIVAGSNTRTKCLAVFLCEILFGSDENISTGVQLLELRAPLLG